MRVTVAVLAAITAVVMGFPVEKSDNLSSGMSDLLSSISSIQERVKGMRFLASGNDTLVNEEVMEGINSLSKNVTYEDLIDRVQVAGQKVKELQQRFRGILTDLDKNYQRPGDKTDKPAAAAAA